MSRIPVAGPWITEKEIAYVTDAVTRCWYDQAGEYNLRFEQAFAAHTGRQFAISLPSCTSGLHLALASLGIGEGDEVIVPDATWIATSAPISYVGATPAFADIDKDCWCLTAESVARCITPRTRALIVVDLYGNMPQFGPILELAEQHGIAVIEDAAEAIGSTYAGRPAGSFGCFSTFSFHGSKTLTTGEGGMLTTDDPELHARCLFLRDHGRAPGDKMFYNSEVAYKYKMSSMQAALGLAQLERIPELAERNREVFAMYRDALDDIPGVRLNSEAPNVRNTYWMVTAVLAPELELTKETLIEALAPQGIDCRPFFYPLSSLPAYEGLPQAEQAREDNVVSYGISPFGVNLPSNSLITRDQVGQVAQALRAQLEAARQ